MRTRSFSFVCINSSSTVSVSPPLYLDSTSRAPSCFTTLNSGQSRDMTHFEYSSRVLPNSIPQDALTDQLSFTGSDFDVTTDPGGTVLSSNAWIRSLMFSSDVFCESQETKDMVQTSRNIASLMVQRPGTRIIEIVSTTRDLAKGRR